jgi:DNA-directed RNA polymerase sigma subunit (sigma70/sigma32)
MVIDVRTVVLMPNHDEVVKALTDVIEAIEANRRTYDAVQRQAIEKLADLRDHPDEPFRETIGRAPHPLVVELLAESFGRLAAASAQLRRAEARALHREGLTMDEIAGLFGVTRQRVSAVLKERPS